MRVRRQPVPPAGTPPRGPLPTRPRRTPAKSAPYHFGCRAAGRRCPRFVRRGPVLSSGRKTNMPKNLLLCALGILLGFILGFFITNAITKPGAQVAQARPAAGGGGEARP